MVEEILKSERVNPGGISGLFTPHLDKRWHIPGAFPELMPERTRETQESLLDAFVLALATGRFEKEVKRGSSVTYYRDWTRAGCTDERRVLVRSHDELAILEAFVVDHSAVQSTIECAHEWRTRLLAADGYTSAPSPEESALFKGLCAPETLFSAAMSAYRASSGRDNDTSLAVERLYKNVRDFLDSTMKTLPPEDRIDKAVSFVRGQLQGLQDLDGFNSLADATKKAIKDIAEGTFRRIVGSWEKEISG
jgi:hypothetical protein